MLASCWLWLTVRGLNSCKRYNKHRTYVIQPGAHADLGLLFLCQTGSLAAADSWQSCRAEGVWRVCVLWRPNSHGMWHLAESPVSQPVDGRMQQLFICDDSDKSCRHNPIGDMWDCVFPHWGQESGGATADCFQRRSQLSKVSFSAVSERLSAN